MITTADVWAYLRRPAPEPGSPEETLMARVVAGVLSHWGKAYRTPADGEDTADAVQALTMQCARLWQRKDSPGGIAAFGEFGPITVRRYDPDIETLLSPYLVWAVG